MRSSLVEQYRRWFEYEKDSHQKVLASFQSVPEDGRANEPFRKAMNLMGHIVAARQMWLHRLSPSMERPSELFPSNVTWDALLTQLAKVEQAWSEFFGRVGDRELEQAFDYQTTEGTQFRSVIADVLTQLYGHSLYHRGQIASLVRAAGGEPAKTDFIFWTRESVPPPAQ
jgi:uncharacterized damage-inducible protein DinB